MTDTAVIHPTFHHFNLKTTRLQEMIDWYGTLVGAEVNFQDDVGAWLSNDAANHRIALLAFPRRRAPGSPPSTSARWPASSRRRSRPSRSRPGTDAMRLVTFDDGSAGPQAGVLLGEEIVPVAALDAPAGSVRGLLEALDGAGLAALGERAAGSGAPIPRASVRLLPPVPDPEKIICMGLNFHDHAQEARQEIPEHPRWFGKFANSLVGDGADVILPAAHADFVDYEAELAVVIGRRAHAVGEAEALSYVAGAMPLNDVSARDLQLQNPLWTSGKAIDTFAPCGPALVTLDEAGDLQNLALRTRINGEVVQDGSTAQMVFGVAETIAWLSRTLTLVPGDIIATGTPAGVGGFKGIFLRDGDTVEVAVEGLGAVSNPVRAA